MIEALLLATAAGLTIPLGAGLALFDFTHPSWTKDSVRHGFLSFGAGALLAAVALVLLPESERHAPAFVVLLGFIGGGVVFWLLDAALSKFGATGQLIAMLLDYLPEAIALGALMALGQTGYAIALMIALQNLPEGFNAFHAMGGRNVHKDQRLLMVYAGFVLLGPLTAFVGVTFLSEMTVLLGVITSVAAGGIVYLVVQDVIPDAHMKNKSAPALGAVAGFALGLAGHLFLPA
jgi:ZIP family zinc transporter